MANLVLILKVVSDCVYKVSTTLNFRVGSCYPHQAAAAGQAVPRRLWEDRAQAHRSAAPRGHCPAPACEALAPGGAGHSPREAQSGARLSAPAPAAQARQAASQGGHHMLPSARPHQAAHEAGSKSPSSSSLISSQRLQGRAGPSPSGKGRAAVGAAALAALTGPGGLAQPGAPWRAAAQAQSHSRGGGRALKDGAAPPSAALSAPRERQEAKRSGSPPARTSSRQPCERVVAAPGFRVRVAAVSEGGAGAARLGDTMALRWWWRWCGASSRRAPALGSLPRLRPPGPGCRSPPPPAPGAAVSAARWRAPGGHREWMGRRGGPSGHGCPRLGAAAPSASLSPRPHSRRAARGPQAVPGCEGRPGGFVPGGLAGGRRALSARLNTAWRAFRAGVVTRVGKNLLDSSPGGSRESDSSSVRFWRCLCVTQHGEL